MDTTTERQNVKEKMQQDDDASLDNSLAESDSSTDNSNEQKDTSEYVIKVDKKLPRSQRKRLIREQRRAKRNKLKQEKAPKMDRNDKVKRDAPKEDTETDGYVSKRIRLQQVKERCQEAMISGQRVCIDLSLEKHMNHKEQGKLAQQLRRLYGSNRKAQSPMHIYFTGFDKDGDLFKECVRKNSGFEGYLVDMLENSHVDVFSKNEIIYLTPDAETVLEKVEEDKVYVIGGLVDESITNNITKGNAKECKVKTARLPIEEKMQKGEKGTFIKVLAVNQVFDILLELSQTGDWNRALTIGVPQRTGYFVAKDQGGKDEGKNETNEEEKNENDDDENNENNEQDNNENDEEENHERDQEEKNEKNKEEKRDEEENNANDKEENKRNEEENNEMDVDENDGGKQ